MMLQILIEDKAGQLGVHIIKALLDRGFTVTVLTRSESHAPDVPEQGQVLKVDYTSIPSLTTALQGQDVLIATLNTEAIHLQHNLIEAAIAASVRRYIPSEFSGITWDPMAHQVPLVAPVMEINQLIKTKAAEGKIEYTLFCPGGFFHLILNNILQWDSKFAPLFDGGISRLSVSRLSTIAQAVAAALEDPAKYKNATVKFHDTAISQRHALDIAIIADPEQKWTEVDLNAKQVMIESLQKLAAGEVTPETFGTLFAANTFRERARHDWSDEIANEELGIPLMAEDELVEIISARLRGKVVE